MFGGREKMIGNGEKEMELCVGWGNMKRACPTSILLLLPTFYDTANMKAPRRPPADPGTSFCAPVYLYLP